MTKQRTFPSLRAIVGLLAVLTVAASSAYAEIPAPPTPDWTWTKTGELTPALRQGFTATLVKLPGVPGDQYPVLVVGGYYPPDSTEPEVVDPVTETQVYNTPDKIWTTGGPTLSTSRQCHTATDLEDGRVLVAGGCDNTLSPINANNCEILDLDTNTEEPINSLNTARYDHTATLVTLPEGGKAVLVVGGSLGFLQPFADTSECYNVATNSWIKAYLKQPRYGHTATLLPNGKVLVVGGFGSAYEEPFFPAIADCEIYDPQNNSWEPVASLHTARGWHTATLLQDGRVLVAGGTGSIDLEPPPLDSYEIYDPDQGTWTIPDPKLYPDKHLQQGRRSHQAILLKDGNVLVVGGTDPSPGGDPTIPQTSEIYQPQLDSWTYIQYGLNLPRPPLINSVPSFTATLLDNSEGWVLVAGGGQTVCELFQPLEGFSFRGFSRGSVSEIVDWSWTRTAALANEIRSAGHTATLLSGGRVLVAGGALTEGWGTLKKIYGSTPIYSVLDNQWQTGLSLANPRWYPAAIPLTLGANAGKVLVIGGMAALSSCELYDGTAWSPAQDLPEPRLGATATLWTEGANAGKVLVTGGSPFNFYSTVLPITTFLYNLDGDWETIENLPVPGRISHTATLLGNGEVLVVGGVKAEFVQTQLVQTPLSSCARYDPAMQQWKPAASLNVARGMHTATLLTNGKVLVAGGQGDSGALRSYEIYDPNSDTWTMSDTELQHLQIPRAGHTAALLTQFPYAGMVLVTGPGRTCEIYNPDNDKWKITRTGLNESRNGHTTTLLEDGRVFVVGGESTTGDGEIFGPKAVGRGLPSLPTHPGKFKPWNLPKK